MRRNRATPAKKPKAARSIPACAGEPPKGLATALMQEVYPRVCGGTAATTGPNLYEAGLSPRVRGNRLEEPATDTPVRSIPACAGEPMNDTTELLFKSVYPRVCGGTVVASNESLRLWGLSPRVRGNPGCPAPGH